MDVQRKVMSSRPGDTYMPPNSPADPSAVLDRWVGEAEITGQVDSYLGKRQHPRFTWNRIMLVRIWTGPLVGKIIRARAQNISLGGIGILMRSHLEPGTLVEVSVENHPEIIRSTVVHCTRLINGNLVGARFTWPN